MRREGEIGMEQERERDRGREGERERARETQERGQLVFSLDNIR
jgi:hypothetical protein